MEKLSAGKFHGVPPCDTKDIPIPVPLKMSDKAASPLISPSHHYTTATHHRAASARVQLELGWAVRPASQQVSRF
jgi:hypothetical protein